MSMMASPRRVLNPRDRARRAPCSGRAQDKTHSDTIRLKQRPRRRGNNIWTSPHADLRRVRVLHMDNRFEARGDLGLGAEGGYKGGRIERDNGATGHADRWPYRNIGGES